MYVPEQFRETDPERILNLIEAYPFAMLVTAPDGNPFVSHLPFLLDRATGSKPRLLGHLARANPQCQHLEAGREVLLVFHGPHAYVSPNWFASPGVPTWNYAVAHVRGVPHLIEDEVDVAGFLDRLTRVHEAALPNPWQPGLSEERKTKLLSMIVAFDIEITDIQAKFKLSQNRPLDDRQRVAEALDGSGNQAESPVSQLIRALI